MDKKTALPVRADHRLILDMVRPNSRVLDLGCGNGELLQLLVNSKNVQGHGIELREEAIYSCIEKGLNVFHSDIEGGLGQFPSKSFDTVILNQSIQEVKNIDYLLKEAIRVGKEVIVGFPNFAHMKSRCDLFFFGRSPVSSSLPHPWNETPNVHFFSIKDFETYCRDNNVKILENCGVAPHGRVRFLANLRAEMGLFLITQA